MASADLRKELQCSICLGIYTDPVMLKCGHNFCWDCLVSLRDSQEGSRVHRCPECRRSFHGVNAVHRNIALRNIVETFVSANPDQEETGIFCTYCVDIPVPAGKFCLHCEASLCDKHLKAHHKDPQHVLIDPASVQTRKCSIHEKNLEHYCIEDAAWICTSCCLIGSHKGHQVESLDEASEKKKNKLRNDLQKFISEMEDTEIKVQSLQGRRQKQEECVVGSIEKFTGVFGDLQKQLADLRVKVMWEIFQQAKWSSLWIIHFIQQLERKKDELSSKIQHIEEMCNTTDPLTVLQDRDTGDLCDTEGGGNEEGERHGQLHPKEDLNMVGIFQALSTLSDLVTELKMGIFVKNDSPISLDENTAGNYLQVSDDKKTALFSSTTYYPGRAERFQDYAQVLSIQHFSSGQHYWEIQTQGSDHWKVGICYPSIAKKGTQSLLGYNDESWGLFRSGSLYGVTHKGKEITLPANITSDRVRIYVDYEAGQISFYDVCAPIRHLHTFTDTFTEPLHVALGVCRGSITICGGSQK